MTSTQHHPSLLTLDRLGVDLRTLDDEQVAAVRAALVEHKVIFFRGQDLDDAAQVELGRRLGEVTAGHPVASSTDVAQPEIYNIDSADPEFSFSSDVWHTDVTFMERRPSAPSCARSACRRTAATPAGWTASWPTSRCPHPCAGSSTGSPRCTTATANGVPTSAAAVVSGTSGTASR